MPNVSQAACPSQHATPVAIVPRVQVAPASVEYARKMLFVPGLFDVATRLFVLVGLTFTKLSAWLPAVALTLTTASRQVSGVNRSTGFGARSSGLYAFAGTIGHIDASGRRQQLRLQDGRGRREQREDGGKHSQAEACVHIRILVDAASKSGWRRSQK